MGFFIFSQNNSGGRFVIDNKKGIAEYVIVEGDDMPSIISKAESIGLYFDGESDCQCCGNRWSEWGEITKTPSLYGKEINIDIPPFDKNNKRRYSDHNCWIHYKDGTKQLFGIPGSF